MQLLARVCFGLILFWAIGGKAADHFEIQAVSDQATSQRPLPKWVSDVEAAFNANSPKDNETRGESQQSEQRLEVLIQYVDSASALPRLERPQGLSIEHPMAEIERQLESDGVEIVKSIPASRAIRARIARSHIEKLAADPSIKAVHTERLYKSFEERESIERPALFFSVGTIHADDVWKRGYTGLGQTIVVIDNGIFSNHEVFAGGKIVQQACFSTPNAEKGDQSLCPNGSASQIGGNAASNCTAHAKACSHGTHVASIAAGNDPSQFFAYDGVAYNSKLIAVQVFKIVTNKGSCPDGPCLLASSFDIFEALSWVKSISASYNIAAVNMSLGSGEYTTYCPQFLLDDPINELRDRGILTTVASGNEGFVGAVSQPACVEAAITVSATIFSFPASWANNAPMVDFLAPGTSITAAYAPPNTYKSLDGTSMAAPHIAGAIALLKSAKPNATPDQIEYALRVSGTKQKSFSWKWETPLVNVEAALDRLGDEAPPRGTHVLSLVSSGNSSGTLSYLRFFNAELFTDSVRVAFVDDLTGKVAGRYSVDVPGDASIQKAVGEMEAASGINSLGKTTYTAVVDSDFDGYVQHVIYNPVGAALTNVTSCIEGLSTDSRTLINVHTSRIPPEYPSLIFIHNSGDADAKADFRIYEASSGRSLGRATAPTIPKGTTIYLTAQAFLSAIGFNPSVKETQTNFELQDGFTGAVVHIVNNTRAGVVTNMTDKCGIN